VSSPVDDAWEKYELCHDAIDSAVDLSVSDRDDAKIIKLIAELDAAREAVEDAVRADERSRYDGLLALAEEVGSSFYVSITAHAKANYALQAALRDFSIIGVPARGE